MHWFINLIQNSILFNRFWATRWIEDESITERTISLWPNIIKIIKHWEGLCKSKGPNRNCTKILPSTTWTNCLC